MKKLSLILVASMIGTAHAAPITLKSPEKDRLGYSYGYLIGKSYAETLKDLNIESISQGLQDAMQGKTASLKDEEMINLLGQYKKRLEAKQLIEFQEIAQKNEQIGKAFLTENAKKTGIVTTKSGLQYQVLQEGKGKSPKAISTVKVNYEGRLLDDDANVLIRFNNGAKGILSCSQIANGDENCLNIRVYGENGSLEWHQMEPNTLMHRIQNDFSRVIRPGVGKLSESANAHIRVPAGHPEGYFEAFANIYRNFARTVRKKMNGQEPTAIDLDFPTIDEGIRGMLFVEKVLESSKSDKKWIKMEE